MPILAQVPDNPAPYYDALCDMGRRLFEEWDAAKRDLPADAGPADRMLARVRESRGLYEFDGLSGEMADRRNRALEAVPPRELGRLRELQHDERMAEVRALEAAEDRRHGYATARPAGGPSDDAQHAPRRCSGCGREHRTGGNYCSRACREGGRPRLFETEEN